MRNRVIIENVKPQIDGGRYGIKRVIGEPIDITAAIFADGHDVLRAEVLYKLNSAKNTQFLPLKALPNDEWSASLSFHETGLYAYKVTAWVDQLATWHKGFLKKQADGQHLDVEVAMGAEWLKKTAEKYPKTAAKALLAYVETFEDKKKYVESVQIIVSEAFTALVEAHPLRQFVTETPWLKVKVEEKKALFSAWYELFPRSASTQPFQHGTFNDVKALLPRVAELGYDILYLPPIHPIGAVNRKGKNNAVTAEPDEPGSPWAIGSKHGGHKSVEPALGTMADYEALVAAAKAQGIDIALDLALQCAPDHPYIQEHPEWFIWRPDGTIAYAENPPKKYQDIVPINFECEDWQNLWTELKSIVLFWVEKGVKVFRVDNPHTKPIPFWEWCMAEVHKEYPDVIFLAEAFTRPKIMASLGKVGYTQSYTYFTWRVTKTEITEYMTQLTQTESREFYRPNFWPNTPDILPYHLHGRNSNAFHLRLALAATLSSNYGVYGAAYEFCDNTSFHGKEEYMDSEKYEIKHYDWTVRNRMTDLMTTLNHIRRENTALQTTWNIEFTDTSSDQLLSYVKISPDTEGGDNIIWCIANLDTENTQSGMVSIPKSLRNANNKVHLEVQDLLTGEVYYWHSDWNYVELNPYKSTMHIFKVKVLNR